jgi:murein DD-endopeptidase MepM/ murein hydrolase activator NlpD
MKLFKIAAAIALLAVSSTAMADTFTVKVQTFFKKTTADSSTLPASDKCLLNVNQSIGAINYGIVGTHWKIKLAGSLSGCGFVDGYLFKDHVTVSGNPSGYTYPLPSGVLGSAWCACRSVGTSPHIGQDTYTTSGTMRAVAVQSGIVESITFSSSCGYFVNLRDDRGALWRYVHLNSPGVVQGARVTNGQQLATISSYPTSACGTGPHLHWERLSAGPFADASTGKDCGQGFRTCNYDPVKPWRTTAASVATVAETRSFSPISTSAPAVQAPKLACKAAPSRYARADARQFSGLPSASAAGIQVSLRYVEREGQRVAVADAGFAANRANVCDADGGRNCIVSWTLLNQTADGSWRRVFHDPATFNNAPARVAEEATCAAEGFTGRSLVVLRDLKGRRYVADFAR